MRRQSQQFFSNPRQPNNPFNNAQQIMQQYQQFKQDYYAQNPNPDPKGAVMGMVQNGQIGTPALQQAMGMAQQFGFKL